MAHPARWQRSAAVKCHRIAIDPTPACARWRDTWVPRRYDSWDELVLRWRKRRKALHVNHDSNSFFLTDNVMWTLIDSFWFSVLSIWHYDCDDNDDNDDDDDIRSYVAPSVRPRVPCFHGWAKYDIWVLYKAVHKFQVLDWSCQKIFLSISQCYIWQSWANRLWRYYFTANKYHVYSYFTIWLRSLSVTQIGSVSHWLCNKPLIHEVI